ncbi:hypothetical protein ACQEU3_46730 [Spirillospora sp. CA-253888]
MVTSIGAAAGGANATSIDLTWPTVQADDVAVLFWLMNNSTTASNPAGFTLHESLDGDSGSMRMRFQSAILTGSETGTLTLTGDTSNRMSAVMAVYRGAHPTSPIDTWATRDEGVAGITHACPQVVTGFADCVIVTAAGERATSGTTGWTAPTGYTERADSDSAAVGTGGTICALADDGLATSRSAGTAVTPPAWASASGFSSANVLTWTVSVRPLEVGRPARLVAAVPAALQRAASW